MAKAKKDQPEEKKATILAFNPVGRIIQRDGLQGEFAAMRAEIVDGARESELAKANTIIEKSGVLDDAAKSELIAFHDNEATKKIEAGIGSASTFQRVASKSGTHLLKLISPKVDTNQGILRIRNTGGKRPAKFLPSVNASDIPFAKIVFRPLEVVGHAPKSLVEHILNPDEISNDVKSAFASVFGTACLEALEAGLANDTSVTLLPAVDFPVFFLPGENGGDIQVTPIAPIASYMAIKQVKELYFQKQPKNGPKVPRGRWGTQEITSSPQNISGAIGGPRVRFMADMPRVLQGTEADLHRFINGGGFPFWNNSEINDWVMNYAKFLEADLVYNDINTRAALDRIADGLIRATIEFIKEMLDAAAELSAPAALERKNPVEFPTPSVTSVILRRRWNEDARDRARNALSGAHFKRRERTILELEGIQ